MVHVSHNSLITTSPIPGHDRFTDMNHWLVVIKDCLDTPSQNHGLVVIKGHNRELCKMAEPIKMLARLELCLGLRTCCTVVVWDVA